MTVQTHIEKTEWLIVYSDYDGDSCSEVTGHLKDHAVRGSAAGWDWWEDTIAEDCTMAWYRV